MTKRNLLMIELCVLISWVSLVFFGTLIYFLDLSSLSSFGLGIAVLLNIPISICYGLFAARLKPPLASFFSHRFSINKSETNRGFSTELSSHEAT